jgi:hypothetical protein
MRHLGRRSCRARRHAGRLKALSDAAPEEYPYLMTIAEDKPANMKLNVRGNPFARRRSPRGLAILGKPKVPKPFTHGSGRLELAGPRSNPIRRGSSQPDLMNLFDEASSPPPVTSVTGERPTHPELLDLRPAVS